MTTSARHRRFRSPPARSPSARMRRRRQRGPAWPASTPGRTWPISAWTRPPSPSWSIRAPSRPRA